MLAKKPPMRPGRYCTRLSQVFTSAASCHVGIGYVIDSGFLTGDTEVIGRHRNERVWCGREPDAIVVTCGASR